VGLVCSSRALIAESRSARVVEAPCMGVPPEREILVLVEAGVLVPEPEAGEAVRDGLRDVVRERTLGRSEIRDPAAEGGGLRICGVGVGA
jgi:hypothetical protein